MGADFVPTTSCLVNLSPKIVFLLLLLSDYSETLHVKSKYSFFLIKLRVLSTIVRRLREVDGEYKSHAIVASRYKSGE